MPIGGKAHPKLNAFGRNTAKQTVTTAIRTTTTQCYVEIVTVMVGLIVIHSHRHMQSVASLTTSPWNHLCRISYHLVDFRHTWLLYINGISQDQKPIVEISATRGTPLTTQLWYVATIVWWK